jgi:hypothetical protein
MSHVKAYTCVTFCLLIVGCSGSAKVPTTYSLYNSKDGAFACEAPDGWEIKGGGGKSGSPTWARFQSGSATIEIKSSVVGSLLSDAQGGASAQGSLPPEFEPVHGYHIEVMEQAKEKYKEYTESTPDPAVIEVPLGPARISEFTAKSAFGTALHGCRGTVIGHDMGFIIYCDCPESEWQVLKPAFEKIFATMEVGTPE